ncbi:LamG-like jellyroll fold domain-containing protein [Rufibacter roseus]|uniref:LamG-like jellyroll fold domain-containing protein n=1 Tax=Rufibacter roseus TaxID=1567108 RepID=A0ABW2DPA3_9BACT|nr:LamG-like jellyroll fold domain-containing protein [Rufibacter roseus]
MSEWIYSWVKTKNAVFSCAVLAAFCLSSCASVKKATWQLKSLEKIGGHSVTVSGEPKLVSSPDKFGIEFDGVNDGLLVSGNPLAGAEEFTIEVVFKPANAWPANVEQRFLHLQEHPDGPRRLLMELRLNNRQQWYADFFLRHEDGSLVLIDSTKTHPVEEWATMTLVYKDKQLKGYVNGELETQGEIEYRSIPASAKVSLGTRMDQRSWFNGIIQSVTFWPKAVVPERKN